MPGASSDVKTDAQENSRSCGESNLQGWNGLQGFQIDIFVTLGATRLAGRYTEYGVLQGCLDGSSNPWISRLSLIESSLVPYFQGRREVRVCTESFNVKVLGEGIIIAENKKNTT